ncbi:retrovirus-related Pol polyprotein from transposon 17.6 [Nephila pilipes]|uniref:Retrovirus-related Pol polyprotein from transposon 17.6 n=1 Tax=Nephila pilipes TaxID=299642 RepID=A0A8X6UAM4_NEPPI|nr:retrovirus-related Pol polyprotein from transposon 17.6 [Nephila pilipes]
MCRHRIFTFNCWGKDVPGILGQGTHLPETMLVMSLADGQQTTGEVFTTQVIIEIDGGSVLTRFIILPKTKGNRTLLGTDFLSSAGLILDVKNACWYFWDNPTHKYPFGEELDTPSIAEKMSSNTCQLREGEGESLTSFQKEKLNLLLEFFQNVFEPGGEALRLHVNKITKGDDSEKGDNEEVQSNNESNRDRESEEDKERPERFIDLDVEMLNDIALWPTTLTDLMTDFIIRKKPNNIDNIETLKSV